MAVLAFLGVAVAVAVQGPRRLSSPVIPVSPHTAVLARKQIILPKPVFLGCAQLLPGNRVHLPDSDSLPSSVMNMGSIPGSVIDRHFT